MSMWSFAGVVAEPVRPTENNLVLNASFEQPGANSPLPAHWNGTPQVYSRDSGAAKTGKASLRYVNADAGRYVLCTQKVPLRPGWKCRFSAWIKTERISGDESGATICLEWQDKDGKWLGGAYPTGIRGTHEWKKVEGVARLPENAASCYVACYVRQEMTGAAWFDDVEIVRVADPVMQSVLVSPAYRGIVPSQGPQEARVRVRWRLEDYDLKPQDIRVHAALLDAKGKSLRQADGQSGTGQAKCLDLALPLAGLGPGQYDLAIRLEGPAGRLLQTDRYRITRPVDGRLPHCFIDSRRRLLVDGKPFFPIGMYWSSITAKDLETFAQSKFNCIMSYGPPTREQMDLAQKRGLKVIYSIKDWYAGTEGCPPSIRTAGDEESLVRARVREYRKHPALLAWYLNDELSQQFLVQLEAHQRWVVEEDGEHPTWVVLYQFNEVAAYLRTFDVIGTDPYPIGRQPASMAAQWTAETFRQVDGARPMWQVPQLHNWANYAKTDAEKKQARTPTHEEVRNMAWQCICEGATGVVFYSWYDVQRNPDVPFEVQWDGLKRLAAEIDRMAPIVLSDEPSPAICAEGNRPGWLHWLARSHAGKLYLVAVNDGDGGGEVVFRLPAKPKQVRLLGDGRSVPCEEAALRIQLPRLAVRCFEIQLVGDHP